MGYVEFTFFDFFDRKSETSRVHPKKKTKAGKFWGALTRCPHGDATGARRLGDELRHTEAAALQVSDVLWL